MAVKQTRFSGVRSTCVDCGEKRRFWENLCARTIVLGRAVAPEYKDTKEGGGDGGEEKKSVRRAVAWRQTIYQPRRQDFFFQQSISGSQKGSFERKPRWKSSWKELGPMAMAARVAEKLSHVALGRVESSAWPCPGRTTWPRGERNMFPGQWERPAAFCPARALSAPGSFWLRRRR